jgi:hypothetical protein
VRRPSDHQLGVKIRKSRLAGSLAGAYVLATLAVVSPLIGQGYIGHGNGVVFLVGTALTSPLSLALFLVNDLLSDANAFYLRGWPYYIALSELGAGALFNAASIYLIIVFVQRRRHHR